jgi:hypothetical protein
VAFYLWTKVLEREYYACCELGIMLFDNEFVHVFTCRQAREFAFDVSLTKMIDDRQFAGVLMLGIGVWYLGFGTRWIAHYWGSEDISRGKSSANPLLTGTQV